MIKLKDILEENYSHMRHLVSDLKNLYYEVDDAKLKKIIVDLIPNGSYYQYTPNKADFYIKKFDELEKLSKRVLKSNNPAFKTIQKIVKGGLEFWNQNENLTEETPMYKDWDEFVNPHHIIVHLKNGKKLKVDRSRVKGGNAAYHAILKAFNDNNYKITNKIVKAMMDNLGEGEITEGKNWAKMMAGVRKGAQSGPWTIVVSRNKKVVYQRQVKVKDAIPANFEDIKNTSSLKGDIYAIEDREGMTVYYEKI